MRLFFHFPLFFLFSYKQIRIREPVYQKHSSHHRYLFPPICLPTFFPLRVYLPGKIEHLYSSVETVDLPTRKRTTTIAYTQTMFEFVTLALTFMLSFAMKNGGRRSMSSRTAVARLGKMAIYRTMREHPAVISINNVQYRVPLSFFLQPFSSADDKLKRHRGLLQHSSTA